MASYTHQDIRSLDRRPMTFLSLSPTTSEPNTVSPSSQEQQQRPAIRRSSSQSSAASTSGLRFLRLGPVQNGEDLDEKAEVAVE